MCRNALFIRVAAHIIIWLFKPRRVKLSSTPFALSENLSFSLFKDIDNQQKYDGAYDGNK